VKRDSFDPGLNRTGIGTSPVEAPKTVQGAEEGAALASGDLAQAAKVRLREAKAADRIGGVPPPATVKGAAKAVVKALTGDKATVLIDKLGERAAFERAGTRLYELALLKAQAYPGWSGGPTVADLQEIHDEELSHYGLVIECLEQLGADPTAMTPSADIAMNLAKGVPAVLADPRTDLRECVEGLLVAELTDNACWETLIELATEFGQDQLVPRMSAALASEQDHLRRVKSWVAAAIQGASHGKLASKGEQPAAEP